MHFFNYAELSAFESLITFRLSAKLKGRNGSRNRHFLKKKSTDLGPNPVR
jgi:hypothetical protein